ncbi:prohead assembly protein [Pectobacterium phage POP12]|nr:prohead assembly protein [Pectobacterium phage POP12]
MNPLNENESGDMLLTEDWGLPCHNISDSLLESVGTKKDGKLYIEGIFLQAEKLNGNKRVYPKYVLEQAVDVYIKTQVNTKQSLGEMGHPNRPTVDPMFACILIEKLWWKGNDVYGRAVVIEGDNGAGDKLAALIRAGWIPGVSSRGMGKLTDTGKGYYLVQEGYKLAVGVDVVWGPSAPDAHVKALRESKEEPEQEKIESNKNSDDSFRKLSERLKGL